MTFFYDMNKRLADIAGTPEKSQLNEGAKPVAAPVQKKTMEAEIPKHLQGAKKSDIPAFQRNPVGQSPRTPLTLQDLDAERDRNISDTETLRKLRTGEPRGIAKEGNDGNLANNAKPYDKVTRGDVIAGRLGKDEMGGNAKHVKEADMDESALQAYLGKKKYGAAGMKALQKAGRAGASKETMAKIRAKHDQMDEAVKIMRKDPFTGDFERYARGATAPGAQAHRDQTAAAMKDFRKQTGIHGAQALKGNYQAKQAGLNVHPDTPFEDEMEEGWDDMMKDVKRRSGEHKPGDVERGHKHDIKHTATGRVVTRRSDDQGISVGADDDTPADAPKRGRGRPKGSTKKMGAKGPSGKSKLMTREGSDDLHDQGEYDREGEMAKEQLSTAREAAAELQSILDSDENLPEWVQSKITKAVDYLDTARDYMDAKDDHQPVNEKAVSRDQAVAARIARGVQKGEVKAKPGSASAEMAKMEPSELRKFAKTPTKGLPKKVKAKEEVEETADETPKTKKGGFQYGKGIYDSMNRELETMIAESMNISMNMNNSSDSGPTKSLTVTATDEDAALLSKLLQMAGVGGTSGCNSAEQVDENKPDWPTNSETSNDALQYAGGINKPKTDVAGDGQTTVPVTAVHSQDDGDLRRMMEMAGLEMKTEGVLGTIGGAAAGMALGGPVGAAIGAAGGQELTRGGSALIEKDDENEVEEGNRYGYNVTMAKQQGLKKADLDGDGDLETVRESMNRLWHAYKG